MCHEAACPEQGIRRRMEGHLDYGVYGLILYLTFIFKIEMKGKPVAVDEAKFRAVCARWRAGEITATAAMKAVGLKPNTFYRRVKQLGI